MAAVARYYGQQPPPANASGQRQPHAREWPPRWKRRKSLAGTASGESHPTVAVSTCPPPTATPSATPYRTKSSRPPPTPAESSGYIPNSSRQSQNTPAVSAGGKRHPPVNSCNRQPHTPGQRAVVRRQVAEKRHPIAKWRPSAASTDSKRKPQANTSSGCGHHRRRTPATRYRKQVPAVTAGRKHQPPANESSFRREHQREARHPF